MAAVDVKVAFEGEEIEIPSELLDDRDVFYHVMSEDTWRNTLTEEEREQLERLLPTQEGIQKEEVIRQLFSGENFVFGNPLDRAWEKMSRGEFSPGMQEIQEQLRELKIRQYKFNQKRYYVQLLQEILVARQELTQAALLTGSFDNLPQKAVNGHKKRSTLERKADTEYARILGECREEWKGEGVSSDEGKDLPEKPTNQFAGDHPISDEEYCWMLRKHRKRRLLKKTDPDLITRGLNLAKVTQRPDQKKAVKSEDTKSHQVPKEPKPEPLTRKIGRAQRNAKSENVAKGRVVLPTAEAQAVYEIYGPIDAGTKKEKPVTPIVIQGPLPDGEFMSFFSVLKHVFEPLHDRKGELNKITKSVRGLLRSSECSGCSWVRSRTNWTDLVLSAMCYLAAEVGAVSSFDPLPHFIPLLEFRDRIDHWKWIGHGRDSDVELLVLCNHWLDNLHRELPIVDYSDYDPPSPHVWTHYMFRQSTLEEVRQFQELERDRYASAHKAFTLGVHGFESPVGPVKGARPPAKKDSGGSRARGHALLVQERPNCVTILSLVRDAVSRLPNGEGTRIDLCVLVRDSQYLQETISETQLNNAVSGALDRLHYEKDPCVRYDSARKVWIYLHRGRSEEDFERIHWASEVASKQRKLLMSRQKTKPKITVKNPDRDITMEGGDDIPEVEQHPRKGGKKQPSKSNQAGGAQTTTHPLDVVPRASMFLANMAQDQGAVIEQSLNPATAGVGERDTIAQLLTVGLVQPTVATEQSRDQKQAVGNSKRRKTQVPPQLKSFDSDWESSDEEEMPFLASSLLPGPRSPSQESTSSWQSSESEGKNKSISATPNFLANISMDHELGEALEASGSDGEGGDTKKGPSVWFESDSDSNSG